MGATASAEKGGKTPKGDGQASPTTREIAPPDASSAPQPPSPMQAKEPVQPAAAPSKPAAVVEPETPTPAPDLSAEDEKKAAPAPAAPEAAPAPAAPEAAAEPSKVAAKAKPQAVPPGPVDSTTTAAQVVPPPPKKDVPGDGKGKGKRAPSAPGTQLCVKNLSKDITPEQLKALFEPLGTVGDVQAKTTKEGKVRGVCFVTMSTAAEASKALAEVNGKEVEGSKLEVSLAEARDDKFKGKGKDGDGKGGKGKGKGKADDRGKGKAAKGKGKGKDATQQAAPTQADYMNAYFPFGYPGMSPYGWPRMPSMPYSYPGALPTGAAMPYGYGMYPGMPQGLAEQQAMAAVLAQAHAAQHAAGMQAHGAQAHASQQAAGMQAQMATQPTQEEYEGSLKSLSQSNGYGFIACEETYAKYKRDVYVDKTLLPEGCKVADRLKFTISLNHKGHPRAETVTLAAA